MPLAFHFVKQDPFNEFPCMREKDEILRASYGTPNTSEVTSIFTDNKKFVLSIKITLLIIWNYKMLSSNL